MGAPNEDSAATGVDGDESSNFAQNAGAVYIFTRRGTTWSRQAYIKASNADASDAFGQGVTLSADGSTLAVAAPFEDSAASSVGGNQADNSAGDAGAAYVFTRSDTQWDQQYYVKASNPDPGDQFGGAFAFENPFYHAQSVALSGDGTTLVIGSHFEDSAAITVDGEPNNNSSQNSGAVYVFSHRRMARDASQ